MYLKTKGRNIILKESTRQSMGWPGVVPPPPPVNPLSALALPGTSSASWPQLAAQAGGAPRGTLLDPLAALRSTNFAPQSANNNPLAALQRPQPPSSGGGSFFGNLLQGIQGAAQNLIQGGVDIAGKLSSGGGAAPGAPPPAASGGIGMGTVLVVGGAGVAAWLLLKKKKA
jgi:hypothetical protein